ncbi:MAG: hypothetical protein EBT02_18755 [Planctomycetia bacterium]|nr:hypothetical protein [Planctomycetia bacterium]
MLRVNSGNVEFAALFAPKPQGMTTANDWTKEMATKGFPDLKKLYSTLGKPENVMLHRGEHHPHNYNSLSRSAFFTFLNHHFKLGHKSPVIENDFDPLTPAQLTVWDAQHPEPKTNGPDFERYLLKYFKDDSDKLLQPSATSAAALRNGIGKAVEIIIGRSYAQAGDSDWILNDKKDKGKYVEMTGIIRNKTYAEELPVTWLYPKEWKGQAVVWLDDAGKSSLYNADGSVKAGVQELLNAGLLVSLMVITTPFLLNAPTMC